MKQFISKMPVGLLIGRTIPAFVLSIGIFSSDLNLKFQPTHELTPINSYLSVPENIELKNTTLTPLVYNQTSKDLWLEGPVTDPKNMEILSNQIAAKTETNPSLVDKPSNPTPVPSPAIAIGGPVDENKVDPSSTPTPQPSPISVPEFSIDKTIDEVLSQWAAHFGVDESLLRHIGMCESGLNPTSLSRNGLYGGMYQFSASTWSSTRNQMSHDPNPELRFHPEEAIKTAAFKIAAGGQSAWSNCLPK